MTELSYAKMKVENQQMKEDDQRFLTPKIAYSNLDFKKIFFLQKYKNFSELFARKGCVNTLLKFFNLVLQN